MDFTLQHIPLLIGRLSSGEAFHVNLAALPNLFISHSTDLQLPRMLTSFIDHLVASNDSILYALSLNSRLAVQLCPMIPREAVLIAYLHEEYKAGGVNTIVEFINELKRELRLRKAKSKTIAGKKGLPVLVIFIDDIFEVIMSTHKKIPMTFIELMSTAAAFNMFFVLGSCGIYRSLLEQLINRTPAEKNKPHTSPHTPGVGQPLGAELVLNPDDLLFFRRKGEKPYERLYP